MYVLDLIRLWFLLVLSILNELIFLHFCQLLAMALLIVVSSLVIFFSFFCRCWYWPLLLLWAIQRPVALTVGRLLVGISLSLRLTWFPCLFISGGLVGCLGGRHIFCWSLQRDTNAKSSKVTFWCLVPSTMMAKNVKAKNLKSWKIILGFISVQTFICAMFW